MADVKRSVRTIRVNSALDFSAIPQESLDPDLPNFVSGLDLADLEFGPMSLLSLSLGGYNTSTGDGRGLPRQLAIGISRSDTEGYPTPPSLCLSRPGMWRFRWAVIAGGRSITVKVKQAVNAAPYPTMVIKANAACGVLSDVVGTSPGGAGWVSIGPIVATATVDGVLWVEFWNNYNRTSFAPAYFDQIIVT